MSVLLKCSSAKRSRSRSHFQKLIEALYSVGGLDHVLIPDNWPAESVSYFLARADQVHPRRVGYNEAGAPGACHLDAAEYWALSPSTRTVWTGFFLSALGLWGEHSWVMESDGTLIAPWPFSGGPRRYFGVPVVSAEVGRILHLGWCRDQVENAGLICGFESAPNHAATTNESRVA